MFTTFIYLLVSASPSSLRRLEIHLKRSCGCQKLAATDQATKAEEEAFRAFIVENEPHFKFRCFEGASVVLLQYRAESVNSSFQ